MLVELHKFGGIPIVQTTPAAATRILLEATMHPPRQAYAVHLVNSYTLSLAHRSAEYRDLLCSERSLNLADGRPLAWVMSRVIRSSFHQIRGPSLFESVLGASTTDVRHFFLGSTDETLNSLVREVNERFPEATVAGTWSPPFRALSSQEVDDQDLLIKRCDPTIVWVGLGTPKQDHEAERLARDLGVMTIAVGAAFDFTARTKRTAPAFMRRWGLEWLFRLSTEPGRLWRRYLVGNTDFLRMAAREWRQRA